jgi:methyl-accepting chemotaxis protein
MTPDERFERQIGFILDQQGKFYVDLQRLEEQLEQFIQTTGERFAEQQDQISHVVGLIGTSGQAINRLSAHMEELSRQVQDTDRRLRDTDERLRDTDERLRATDQRLNAFIKVVERSLRAKNGKQSARKKKRRD